ncbi:MAG TPA: PAS domain S-box protein [Candidatus Dormibacteraeota bacterium]|nr:PAS domain S-box protein [Candidatus Dormibacteraeota bacterium]
MTGKFDLDILRRLDQFVTGVSLLSVAFGLWVLTGWILHIQIVKSIVRGQVAVKANAAICFILIGFALWVFKRDRARAASSWKLAAKIAAVIASIVGLLSLLEFLLGWNLGIDQLLFTAKAAEDIPGSVRPGLMSPIAAWSFLSLGSALLLLDAKSRLARWWTQALPCGAAIAAMFGILDFVLDPNTTHTHISPITASAVFLLSFALPFTRTQFGLGALVASPTLGGSLTRLLFPAAILVPLAVGWLRWKGELSGLYSEWAGLTMMTVFTIVLLASLTAWCGFTVDRNERERLDGQETVDRLASIVTSSSDAIFAKTLEGVATSWNPGAEAIYGYSAEEMIGQSISVSIPPDRRQDFDGIMEKIARGERVEHYETTRLKKGGRTIHVSLSISPVLDKAGHVVGASTIARDITERKQAEQSLRDSESKYRTLFDSIDQGFCTIEMVFDGNNQPVDYRFLEVNPAFERQTGIENAGGRRMREIAPELEPYWFEIYGKVALTGEPVRFENPAAQLHRWYEVYAFRVGEPQQKRVAVLFNDISERKRSEEKVRIAALYTRSLIESSLDPLVTISRDGKITDVNQATETVTGVSRERLIGSDFSVYFTQPEKARQGYEQVFAEGHVTDYGLAIRHTSGRVTDVLYNASVLKNEAGEIEGVFAAARDVTRRKQAEEELRRASLYTRSLIEASLDPLVTISRSGKITDVNQATESVTGVSRERLIGSDFSVYFTQPEKARQGYEQVFAESKATDYPLAIRHASGRVTDVLYNASVFKNEAGEIEGVFAAARDITRRKLVEEELRLSRERLALAQKAGHSGTFDWDIQKNINHWSTEVEEVYGIAPGEFGGSYEDWEALVVSEDLITAKTAIEESLKTGEFASEWRIRRRNDGEIRWITARAKVIFDNAGRPERMLGLNMDVTERKRAEEEVHRLNGELELRVIQRTAQLEAANKELEAFTYSVSHDLRAPLRHISGFSKLLTEEYGSSLAPEAQHHLQRIQEGTRRMGLLVDDLLNLGRIGRHEVRLQVTGLNTVVNEVIGELKPECGERQMEWKIGALPFVECDPALMKQVFQNLLSNAVKFTRPRGQAVIEVGQKDQDGTPVVFVRDNGVGFSMKYADKLFGVFQRLHRAEDFEGTGVGLATVQRIIQKHGGRIWAEAELDKGATFYFTVAASVKTELNDKTAMAGASSHAAGLN